MGPSFRPAMQLYAPPNSYEYMAARSPILAQKPNVQSSTSVESQSTEAAPKDLVKRPKSFQETLDQIKSLANVLANQQRNAAQKALAEEIQVKLPPPSVYLMKPAIHELRDLQLFIKVATVAAEDVTTANILEEEKEDIIVVKFPPLPVYVPKPRSNRLRDVQLFVKASVAAPAFEKSDTTPPTMIPLEKIDKLSSDSDMTDEECREGGKIAEDESTEETPSGVDAAQRTAVSYATLGASAPELGVGNKGRVMLEKMGWTKGKTLGFGEGSGRLLVPIEQKVKFDRMGLS